MAESSAGTEPGASEVLFAPLVIEFPFTRTVGAVQGAFLTGLREQIILGIRKSDGGVLVPPTEYDPETAEELSDLVEVGQSGVVTTWTWLDEPRPRNPVQRGFAWAVIQLDGADTGLLHAVDAGDESKMATGWRDEREGQITDIECFVPEGA
jgi:hypothetical protein